MMSNPYFQTDHYKNESNEAQIIKKIDNYLFKNPAFKYLVRIFNPRRSR